jgi:DNA-binding XRE family transcriptional regulator
VATRAEVDAALADLGRQLAARRKAAGLTQQQLAERTPFKRQTIGNAEAGTRRSARFWQVMDDELNAGGTFTAAFGRITAAAEARRLPPLRPTEDAGPAGTVTSLARCPHCHREISLAAQVSLSVAGEMLPGMLPVTDNAQAG